MTIKNEFLNRIAHLVFSICLLFLIVACSPTGPVLERDNGDLKIQVKSGGKVVKNPETELVHRIDLSENDLNPVLTGSSKLKALGFKAKILRDAQGGISGILLDLRAENQNTQRFGLQHGDLVTAISGKLIGSEDDLETMFQQLQEQQKLSVTVMRDGEPHKLLYSIVN